MGVTHLLEEDYLKNSDVGEAAKLEAEREEEEHQKLLKENEEENLRVAQLRQKRLEEMKVETRVRIEVELEEAEEKERIRIETADAFVRQEAEEIDNSIKVENVQEAIEEALDNPVDYEFAIDTQGHIFTGRETKSKKVPKEKWEKLPMAVKEDDKMIKFELEN